MKLRGPIREVAHAADPFGRSLDKTAAEVVLNGRPAWRLGLAVRLLPVDRDNERAEAREVLMSCIFPAPRRKGKAAGWAVAVIKEKTVPTFESGVANSWTLLRHVAVGCPQTTQLLQRKRHP
jgi:hypothetical protein